MANWLERAKREIQKTPCRPTANTDVRILSAVTAVPRPAESGNSRASNGSNGSTSSGDFSEIEAATHRLWDARGERANLETLLAEACRDVEGIDAATFRALLSPEDIENIEGGFIPMVTLNAYARSFAEGIRGGRITVLAPAIPKPVVTERVRCADCRHFEWDIIGDGSGIGGCKIGGEGTGPRYPALWANAERECKDFEARYTQICPSSP